MSLIFKEEGHLYKDLDPNSTIEWKSVTKIIGLFKSEFDAEAVAAKCSKNRKSKWYKIPEEKILEIWKTENLRATGMGTFYHNEREADLISCDTLNIEGYDLPVIPPKIIDGLKYAPEQKLNPGIYPEHFVYLTSAGACGQADYLDVVNGKINIMDYKTNKEIKFNGYTNWKGETTCLSEPLTHIEDCNYEHYCLQLSMYMYMALKHNPHLEPGKLTLRHIIFKQVGENEYGYPIIELDENDNPVVDEVVIYELPYLKEEVLAIINHIKNPKKNGIKTI